MLFSDASFFSIHDWHISHSQLLIRSFRSDSDPQSENIDLIFVGVSYLEITDVLRGVEISDAGESDAIALKQRAERQDGTKFFKILSNGRSYYIGAFSFRVERNKLGILESSLGYWPQTKSYVPKENIFDED